MMASSKKRGEEIGNTVISGNKHNIVMGWG